MPAIRRLHYRHNCRIFQQLSVPAIIDQVLGDAGLSRDTWRTSMQGRHPVRDYCVQYRESELAFISRLMEEEGIFYSFEHHADHHVLVMADHPAIHPTIAGGAQVRYQPRQAGQISTRHIFAFNYTEAIRPGVASLRDYNFKRPAMDLTGTRRAEADRSLEVYDYPGLYDAPDQGNSLANVRLEEWRVARQGASGESVCAQLLPGELFELTGFPRGDRNTRYLITRLITEGAEPQALEETAGSAGSEFHNRFECLPATVTFRPPRVTPKPRIQGSQTAIVVGPAGEEIYTDEYGRIKVQFHWDREGNRDEKASCWIRTSQAWAGGAWGGMSIPRIGHEVIVDFLEGDPDRPIVTGRVYHGTNRPPYHLPEHKTRTTFKSDSSKGGGGFNELRFEDKKGQEQVFIHAEKDQDNVVKHDETTKVGHDRTETVGHNETITIGNNRSETVGSNETIHIGANRTEGVGQHEQVNVALTRTHSIGVNDMLNVGGAQQVSVGLARMLSVGLNQTTNVGKHLTINAGDSVTIVTGKASITMHKDGTIVIAGMDISIKGSGAIQVKASKDIVIKGRKIAEN